jgi:hypothetical protein
MNRFLLYLLLICAVTFNLHAQSTERKAKFGLQFKPLTEGGFVGSSQLNLKNDTFQSIFNQKFGYSFGAIVRFPVWKNLYIETGLAQVQRNYQVDYITLDSNFTASKSLSFVSHDIPINALVFIKMSEKFYLNTAMGVSLIHNPSNVASQIKYGDNVLFKAEGRKRSNFAFEFNITTGIEYRNTRYGSFYLGASGRIPFRPIFNVATMYQNVSTKQLLYGSLTGTYVSLDLRYFLPKTKKPKIKYEKGPLDE